MTSPIPPEKEVWGNHWIPLIAQPFISLVCGAMIAFSIVGGLICYLIGIKPNSERTIK